MNQGYYTVRTAWVRLAMLAALMAGFAWTAWWWQAGPEPLDFGVAFVKAVSKGVFFILPLSVPFMLKDLLEAYRYRRLQREQMERAYRSSGRHDTGLKPWGGSSGSAPDGWE